MNKPKFRVEVALLFQDKTWDTVFLEVEALHESLARRNAEETIRKTCKETVSHIATVFVQHIEEV